MVCICWGSFQIMCNMFFFDLELFFLNSMIPENDLKNYKYYFFCCFDNIIKNNKFNFFLFEIEINV